jgi:hypothetical protein
VVLDLDDRSPAPVPPANAQPAKRKPQPLPQTEAISEEDVLAEAERFAAATRSDEGSRAAKAARATGSNGQEEASSAAFQDMEELAMILQQRFRTEHDRAARRLQTKTDQAVLHIEELESRMAQSIESHCRTELARLQTEVKQATAHALDDLKRAADNVRSLMEEARKEVGRAEALQKIVHQASEIQKWFTGHEQDVRTELQKKLDASLNELLSASEALSAQAAQRVDKEAASRLKNFEAECDRMVNEAFQKWRTAMAEALGAVPGKFGATGSR